MRKKVQVGGDHRLFACLVCHFHRGQTRQILIEMEISWDLQVLGRFFWMKDKRLAAQLKEKTSPWGKNTLPFLQNKGFVKGFFVTSYTARATLATSRSNDEFAMFNEFPESSGGDAKKRCLMWSKIFPEVKRNPFFETRRFVCSFKDPLLAIKNGWVWWKLHPWNLT